MYLFKRACNALSKDLKGAHLMPHGEDFITWDSPVEILLGDSVA